MFEFKPDYEQSKRRIDAFWEREVIDRPVVHFTLDKPPEKQKALPPSHDATPAERWLDAQYQAELTLAILSNREFLGDTMPIAYPNLGPSVFSALYGCPLHFGDFGTSWTEPILEDWDQVDCLQLDWSSPYLKKLQELTDAFLEIGKGKFITGMSTWHPGGDCVASLRGAEDLALDMLFHRDKVRALLSRIEADYFRVYDMFYSKLRAAGQPISTHAPLICSCKFGVPLNDFSIMISKDMFDDVFLPGIIRECQFLDRSLYHLDGPGALRHLDSILSIPELDALQFVPGAGNEGFHRWISVYKKAQASGKGIQVFCSVTELDLVMETLDPHGLFLSVSDVPSRTAGETLLDRLTKWCVRQSH